MTTDSSTETQRSFRENDDDRPLFHSGFHPFAHESSGVADVASIQSSLAASFGRSIPRSSAAKGPLLRSTCASSTTSSSTSCKSHPTVSKRLSRRYVIPGSDDDWKAGMLRPSSSPAAAAATTCLCSGSVPRQSPSASFNEHPSLPSGHARRFLRQVELSHL